MPVLAAIEGRAHIHSDYALLANVIVAAEGATFQDVGHYAAGVVHPFTADKSIPREKITALDARYSSVIQALDDLVEAVGLKAA